MVQSQISAAKPRSWTWRIRSARGRSRRTISTQTARVKGLLGTATGWPTAEAATHSVSWPAPHADRGSSDIAAQSGLSRATVDRVLHGREGVRPETVAQVERAVAELERQRTQASLSGRTLLLDLVMQAPERFSTASRQALEAELASLRPAVLRSRAQLSEQSDPEAAAAGARPDRGSRLRRGDPQGARPPPGRGRRRPARRARHPGRSPSSPTCRPAGGRRTSAWTTARPVRRRRTSSRAGRGARVRCW